MIKHIRFPQGFFYYFLLQNLPSKPTQNKTAMNEAKPPTWSSKTPPPGPPGHWRCAAPGWSWLLRARLHCCRLGSHWNFPPNYHPSSVHETSRFLQRSRHGKVTNGWVAGEFGEGQERGTWRWVAPLPRVLGSCGFRLPELGLCLLMAHTVKMDKLLMTHAEDPGCGSLSVHFWNDALGSPAS